MLQSTKISLESRSSTTLVMRCCPTTARTTASTIRHHATRSCTRCPQVTSNLFCFPGSTPSCECGRKVGHKKESRKGAFDHHDTLETWMPGAVVMGLLCTFFTPIQAVTTVEGLTGCYDIQNWWPFILCPTRSNIQQPDFLAITVKFNSYVSSVMH